MTNAQTEARAIAEDAYDNLAKGYDLDGIDRKDVVDTFATFFATALAAKDEELAAERAAHAETRMVLGTEQVRVIFTDSTREAAEAALAAERAALAEARKALNYLNDAIEVGLPDQEISRRSQLLVSACRALIGGREDG